MCTTCVKEIWKGGRKDMGPRRPVQGSHSMVRVFWAEWSERIPVGRISMPSVYLALKVEAECQILQSWAVAAFTSERGLICLFVQIAQGIEFT